MGRYEDVKKKAEKKEKEERLSAIEAKNRKRSRRHQDIMRENRRRLERVTIWNGAPYISEALAKKLHGDWRSNYESKLEKYGVKRKTVNDTPYFEARAFLAVASAGALGSNHTILMNRRVFQSVDNLEEPKETVVERGDGTTVRKDPAALGPMRITEELMRDKFDRAISAIEEQATDARFNKQPREVRLAAWAAKENDPRKGPADSLEDCFPLEVGQRISSGAVLWTARADEEESSEEGE